ncbi:MAG: YbaK/EbsC family protein [Armatimonadota bacterium]|nr:YbaK/EbsC family protein [Armatimonadota bacterium]MDR7421634.1 YbaK/EbsC family protein [Armatimonadota bacterium]MDR7454191.1 YbaK/EbsC family protein [Armatimonadota bacterium]MDR7455881.1 YbaK/EbsC family protein [Armatimonadota bacterium]MDR7497821.1 YbaK/EbsC family protein [Armatimonadota bacterium]
MQGRERLEAYLREHGVRYEVTPHAEAYTAQEVAAAEHVSGRQFAKVVIAEVDGTTVMLVLPAALRVDLLRVRAALGARSARLAREEEFAPRFPDCEPGAMPPFGHLYGVPVYMDRSLAGQARLVFNACSHRETITMAGADYERLARPTIADFAAQPAPAAGG